MIKYKSFYCFLGAILLISSCDRSDRKSYAIRDFDQSLQPYLRRCVTTGVVGDDSATAFINANASDKELILLSRCEHPILRAVALSEMQRRLSFDHFSLIMTHLDDTAVVATYAGEWGIRFKTVSDYIIENGRWKTDDDRKRTIDEIIKKHDYLKSAYTGVSRIGSNEKYYPFVKEMAGREILFEDRENALYTLAAFKRREDIPYIKEILLINHGVLTGSSFALMEDFPDSAYMGVFERWYPRNYYRSICHDQFTSPAASFIAAVASYKTARSAKIINAILSRKPFMPCAIDTDFIMRPIVNAIWNNPCNAFSKLQEHTKAIMEKYKIRESDVIPVDSANYPKDTIVEAEPIRWW
jgi:hypothetical protein